MRLRAPARTTPLVVLVAAATALSVPPASAGVRVQAAPAVRALATFPTDALTVPDRTQLTGRRVQLPMQDCARQQTQCDVRRLLNQLDGFDLDPRMSVTFSRPVDPAVVAAQTTVEKVRGTGRALTTGVERVVYDPQHASVFMHPAMQLDPSTTYRLRVRAGNGLPAVTSTFTTLSATVDLRRMIGQLDSGLAFQRAGISGGDLQLSVDRVVPASGTALTYTTDRGAATSTVTTAVPNLSSAGAGSYVFGSFLAPSWLTPERLIPQTPTGGSGPSVRGRERLPFVMIVPASAPPAGGFPVAVWGHGFTRSTADVFLAAATNASRGVATIATNVVGHGGGPRSTWGITREGQTTSVPAYGRSIDQDGDGLITSTEGSSTLGNPSRFGAIGSRDALRQTVADIATMIRAVGRGVDVNGGGTSTVATSGVLGYYGQSFGGIYGTMLGGADPAVKRLGLNVPGGPINEIVRLSPVFRPLLTASLGGADPSLLNGGTYGGFTESMPLPGDPAVRTPAAGALAIQEYLSQSTWLDRPGSPETYAPLLRATPAGGNPAAAKQVLFQTAFGDQTVPNPTTYTILRAGSLFDRNSLYRNDRTPQASSNPHGFLLNPVAFPQAALPGQRQLLDFLTTGTTTDPDQAGNVWEVPVADPQVLRNLNFPNPLHP